MPIKGAGASLNKGTLYSLEESYPIIPIRSTRCLDKSLEGGYIRLREPGAPVTNMTYKRN